MTSSLANAFATGRVRLLLALLCAVSATSTQAEVRSYVTDIPELLANSPASDWQAIADEDLVLLELASGTVVAELAPFASPAQAQRWRELVRSGYFAKSSVQRVHEHYVVQWGPSVSTRPVGKAGDTPPDETTFAFTPELAQRFLALDAADSYAPHVGFIDGFAVGLDKTRERGWLLHCFGAVGTVQEDPDTLPGGVYYYAAIGNPTRELDGRIPVVARIIEGIEAITTLPRGSGIYGFFDEARYVPILRTRVAADLPATERPRFERLRTGSDTFAAVLRLRVASLAKRGIAPAPYPVDACSVPLPVRRVAADNG